MHLRDEARWRLAYDSADRANEILSLDLLAKTAMSIDKGDAPRQINWYTHTAHLLTRLCIPELSGPVFLAQLNNPHTPGAAPAPPSSMTR